MLIGIMSDGGAAVAWFRPHPRGPWPYRERVESLWRRERALWETPVSPPFANAWLWLGKELQAIRNRQRPAELWNPPVYSRGFISSVTCTTADWLAHADALVWHPGQNRPCPETAQPVTRVRLTTLPTITAVNEWETDKRGRHNQFGFSDSCREMFADRWPGIEFELPAQSQPVNPEWLMLDDYLAAGWTGNG